METGNDKTMENSESVVDRISSLPTEILHNILSLVHIRSVVQMRRLSRRWREVCESLQFVCLRRQDFENWTVDRFTRFVSNLLLLRAKVDLYMFQLHWPRSFSLNFSEVMMWIYYAVKHNVKVLDMELGCYDHIFLPHCIFTCPSLQEINLQLEGTPSGRYVLPHTINLPSLRKLTLVDVEVSQLSLNQIIAQSPGLEDLNLRECVTYFDLVESKVLKSLTFYSLGGLDRFTVAAPHLVHFQCIGSSLEDVSWRERPCLESVHVESNGNTFDGQYDFTGIILHAKRVKLLTGTDGKVMLEKELPTCSVFENLEFLQIGGWCLIDSLNIILRFLQLSPRLQKLILTHGKFPEVGKGTGKDALPNNEIRFYCPLLQTVIIQCSKYDSEIDSIVNAMVDNGLGFEKIQITFFEDVTERSLDQATSYAGSEYDTIDQSSWNEDDDDSYEPSYEDNDNVSMDDDEDVSRDEDNYDDEIEDEDEDNSYYESSEDEDNNDDEIVSPDEDNDQVLVDDDDKDVHGDEDNEDDEIEDDKLEDEHDDGNYYESSYEDNDEVSVNDDNVPGCEVNNDDVIEEEEEEYNDTEIDEEEEYYDTEIEDDEEYSDTD